MLIKIKVFPESKKEEIIRKADDSYDVLVKEKAERNQANKKMMELLRVYFKEAAIIKLIKGSRSRSKIFEIH